MTLQAALFWIIAAGTAASAVGVVLSRGVIRAAVYLLFTLVGVSLNFFLLDAEFLGAAQLMIYVGGTLVLVVFGGMLTAGGLYASFPIVKKEWVLGGLLAAALFGILTLSSLKTAEVIGAKSNSLPGLGPIGLSFLGVSEKAGGPSYLLPFEIVSIHLLVVLIGAAYLARAKKRPNTGGAA